MRGTARRALISVAAVILAVPLVGAPPAHAGAGKTISVTCGTDTQNPRRFNHSVVLKPGEQLIVQTSGCTYFGFGSNLFGTLEYVEVGGAPMTINPSPFGGNLTFEPGSAFTFTAPLELHAMTWQFNPFYYGGSANFGDSNPISIAVCTDGVCPVPADPSIPAWIQSYGRSGSEATCADGWAPTWEAWPDGGSGGFTCSRSLPAFGTA